MLIKKQQRHPLHLHEHIRDTCVLRIGKGKGHGHQVCMRPGEDRPKVDMGMCCIIVWKLNDLNVSLIIKRDYVGSEFESPEYVLNIE